MNAVSKEILIDIVRKTIAAAILDEPLPSSLTDKPDLETKCGCFVTIKNGSRLRGCIGQFTSNEPLLQLAILMAKAAATGDSRFFNDPITADELDKLSIDISVLSPLVKTDNPMNLKLGVHGIFIVNGQSSGCFLPQVATETGWTKEEFLSNCCDHKAGLAPDAWKDAQSDVYLFTAEVIED